MSPDDPAPESPVPMTPAAAGEPEGPVFTPAEYDPLRASNLAPTRRPAEESLNRSRLKMWLLLGGLLWAIGLGGWLLLFVQGCESDGDSSPAVKKKK